MAITLQMDKRDTLLGAAAQAELTRLLTRYLTACGFTDVTATNIAVNRTHDSLMLRDALTVMVKFEFETR